MPKFGITDLLSELSKDQADTLAAMVVGGEVEGAPGAVAEIVPLSVYDLVPSKENFYSTKEVEDLKFAIELLGGIQQNLVVFPLEDGKYLVIAGHRRRLASIALVEEGKPQYERVPCAIIKTTNPHLRKLILMLTNSTARKPTEWERMQEAAETRAELEALRDEGKLKGDMRKLVAKFIGENPTKVAKLDAIRHNLATEFMEEFRAERIKFSAALELSGMSPEDQRRAFEDYRETGEISYKEAAAKRAETKPPKKTRAQEAAEVSAVMNENPCPVESRGKTCDHGEIMAGAFLRDGNLEGCPGCCADCEKDRQCPHVCGHISTREEPGTEPPDAAEDHPPAPSLSAVGMVVQAKTEITDASPESTKTYEELLTVKIPKTGCPMTENVPMTDEEVSHFCNKGCSEICPEELKKALERKGCPVEYVEPPTTSTPERKKKAAAEDADPTVEIISTMRQLESLREYCNTMDATGSLHKFCGDADTLETGEDSREWSLDSDALGVALRELRNLLRP